MKHFPLVLALLFAPGLATAATAPKATAAAWLDLGVGARALGMGGAVASLVDDASAVWWNPAGLSQLAAKASSQEFLIDGNALSEGRQLNHLGYASRSDGLGTLGMGLSHYGLTLEGYDAQGKSLGTFQDMGLALYGAWASEINWNLRYGTSVRVLHQALGTEKAWGYAADLGILVRPFEGSSSALALTLQNVISTVQWSQGRSESASPNLRLGISDRPLQDKLVLSADVEMGVTDGVWIPHLGAELWPTADWAFRTGWQPGQGFGGGLSWLVSYYQFDYGFGWEPLGLGQRHEASVTLKL